VQPARVIVDEAATGFFGGHKPMPGGASLAPPSTSTSSMAVSPGPPQLSR
jgi:hypothetical protein